MKRTVFFPKSLRLLCLALAFLLLVPVLSGCALTDLLFGTESTTTVAPGSTGMPEGTTNPEASGTAAPVNTTEPVTGTAAPGDVTTSPEDTGNPVVPTVLYTDPLTGLQTAKDYSRIRPVSIVIDNTSLAFPQSGLSSADIVVEVPVEGGITRLILITNKYEDQNYEYGPVRSTRDYMVGLCQAFGTLMVGAGGSPTGYQVISANRLDYIDGVNDSVARSFFRSDERKTKSGYEHSLMITANGIRANASYKNYSLVRQSVGQLLPFVQPSAEGTDPTVVTSSAEELPNAAMRTILTYSSYQQVQMIYSAQNNAYFLYEFGTKPHYDVDDGQQLRFENVLILFSEQNPIPGDEEGRLNVQTTGTGTGYYLSGGTYQEITWKRDAFTSAFEFRDTNGKMLNMTPGKTMITLMDAAKKGTDAVLLNHTMEADS